MEEKTKLGGQTRTARYVWGEGLLAAVEGGQVRYVHADGLGSVAALSDAAGAVTDTYGYDAFGNALGRTGSSGQPYRFAGEHFDPAAGMQYHRARWYDMGAGRFASLDPFARNPNRPGTLNKYAYVGSDPVNSMDPSGKATLTEEMAGIEGLAISWNAAIAGVRGIVTNGIRRSLFAGKTMRNAGMITLVTTLAITCMRGAYCMLETPLLNTGWELVTTSEHILDAQSGNGDTKDMYPAMLPAVLTKRPRRPVNYNDEWQCNDLARDRFNTRTGLGRGVCDEYPFASTEEGGQTKYDQNLVSLRLVPPYEQLTLQRNLLRWFYRNGPVEDNDIFISIAIPFFPSFMVDKRSKFKWWM